MFDTDQRRLPKALPTAQWDHTIDPHPRPYQPGWRRPWFRRHRAHSFDDEHPGQPRLFTG